MGRWNKNPRVQKNTWIQEDLNSILYRKNAFPRSILSCYATPTLRESLTNYLLVMFKLVTYVCLTITAGSQQERGKHNYNKKQNKTKSQYSCKGHDLFQSWFGSALVNSWGHGLLSYGSLWVHKGIAVRGFIRRRSFNIRRSFIRWGLYLSSPSAESHWFTLLMMMASPLVWSISSSLCQRKGQNMFDV